VTELRGPGWKDNRPFITTLADPFDLWGLFRGHDKKTRFWDMDPAELKALTAEHRQKKAERLARPRTWWEKAADPLHLFGSRGRIVAWAKTVEKKTPDDTPVAAEPKPFGNSKAHGNAEAEEIV